MSEVAITAQELSKRYRIGLSGKRHDLLFDAFLSVLRSPIDNFRQLRRLSNFSRDDDVSDDTIWALKDLSFEVMHGEVLGIIGRNGAGKSTLLKILARITEPSSGTAVIHGRISSLLEVGTGFHPELTGRENIYLNGTILGMRKREIDAKFDEIVEFSGVEKFLDTPVKRYSSGMRVRLAFSVAAHLEPEILVIDEVLAVGDAAFQKRCLKKMGSVAQAGRTVLFVSHNMGQIKRLCTRGIWLDQGQCVYDGDVNDAVAAYQMRSAEVASSLNSDDAPHKLHTGFVAWRIANSPTGEEHVLRHDGEVVLELTLSVRKSIATGFHSSLVLRNADGQNVAGWGVRGLKLEAGLHKILYTFPSLPVRPGVYYWYSALWDPKKVDETVFPQELVVATSEHSTLNEEWAGLLNLPCTVQFDRV